MTQRNESLKILQRSEELFGGKFGNWTTDPVDFKLKEYLKPIYLRPYPVLKVHEKVFKKEVKRLFLLGIIKIENYSEWGALSFAQPKLELNKESFIGDYRNLNKQFIRKPYYMPKISEILLKLEVF